MANVKWVKQQLDKMDKGIKAGKTRKRNVESVKTQGVTEKDLADAVRARGWKLAEIGKDYVVAPGDYVIKPIV